MKCRVFAIIFPFMVLLPLLVLAGQDQSSGHRSFFENSRQPGNLNLPTQGGSPAPAEQPDIKDASFDFSIRYSGLYEADRLYIKSPDATLWRGSVKPAFIKEVICAEATRTLYLKGWWLGHLNRDGSCGSTAEPLMWATGNLLNFDAQSE